MGMKDDEPIEHSWVTSQLKVLEEVGDAILKPKPVRYDDVMDLQRTAIYEMRKKALKEKAYER